MAENEPQQHTRKTRKSIAKKSEKLEQIRRVVELNAKCWSQDRIADDVGISQGTVSNILKTVSQKYWDRILEERNQEVVSQVNRLNHLVDEAMQGWERSKDANRAISKKTDTIAASGASDDEGGNAVATLAESVVIKSVEQNGDLKFLEDIRESLADIRKILGIDAPTKSEQQISVYSKLSDDELASYILGDIAAPKTRTNSRG